VLDSLYHVIFLDFS